MSQQYECPACKVRRDVIGGELVCPICHKAEPIVFAPPGADDSATPAGQDGSP